MKEYVVSLSGGALQYIRADGVTEDYVNGICWLRFVSLGETVALFNAMTLVGYWLDSFVKDARE